MNTGPRSTMLPRAISEAGRSFSLSLFPPSTISLTQSHRGRYLCGSFFHSCSPCLYLTELVLPQDRCSLGPVVARSSVNHTVKKRSQCSHSRELRSSFFRLFRFHRIFAVLFTQTNLIDPNL